MPPGHGRLEVDRHTAPRRLGKQLAAVLRDQGLVRRDHVLAPLQRVHHPRERRLDPADHLDDDPDLRIVQHVPRIGGEQLRVERRVALPGRIPHEDLFDHDLRAEAPLDVVLILLQDAHNAAADVPRPQQPQ